MRKLSLRTQILLVLWKYLTSLKKSWKIFIFEILAKISLAYLVYHVFEEGVTPKPIWPFDDDEPKPDYNFRILYVSNSRLAENLILRIKNSSVFHKSMFEPISSEEAIVHEWVKGTVNSPYNIKLCGIIFHKATKRELDYEIRLSQPIDESIFSFTEPTFRNFWRMHYAIFLQLQCEIDSGYISKITGQEVKIPIPEDIGERIEYDPYHKARILHKFVSWTGLFICVTLFFNIVQEKESMEKDHLRVMGISNHVLWIGRFLETLLKSVVSNALVCIVLNYALMVSWIWLWLYIIFYNIQMSAILFFMSVFFRNKVTALTFALTVWILGGVAGQMFMFYSYMFFDNYQKMALSFFIPNTSLAVGFIFLAQMEFQLFNNDETSTAYYSKQLLEMLGVMTISTILFWVLAVYLDPMWQPEQGATWKPWPFAKRSVRSNISAEHTSINDGFNPLGERKGYQNPPKRIPAISLRNVTKKISTGKQLIPALDNISFDVFKNEVTVLLGENGSGKSLAIAMIVGWRVPSEGKITIGGLEKTGQTNSQIINANIGWCPQENRVLSGLTILELMQFACKLRRIPREIRKIEIKRILSKLDLHNIRNKMPAGMPNSILRRICFSFAIIGKPRIVVLDDPATGVDYHWRRQMWELIRDLRGNRVVLLTTNHMGDAEEIADRIIILGRKKVLCWGSPRFLKNFFHCGFQLMVERSYSVPSTVIKRIILDHYPNALRRFSSVGILVFVLPPEEPSRIVAIVRALRESGVAHMALAQIGMEEVFLKATQTSTRKPITENINLTFEPENFIIPNQKSVQWKQFLALSKKELLHMKRSCSLFIFGAVLLFLAISILMELSNERLTSKVKTTGHKITLKDYRGTVLYDVGRDVLPNLEMSFEELVKESYSEPAKVVDIRRSLRNEERKNSKYANREFHVAAHLGSSSSGEGVLIPGQPAYTRSGTHSPAVAVNLFSNAVLRALGHRRVTISLINHQMPFAGKVAALSLIGPWFWSEGVVLVLAIWLVGFGRAAVEERLNGAQYDQLAAGASPAHYWLARFFLHIATHAVMMAILLVTTLMGGLKIYSCPSTAGAIYIVWFLYGVAEIPFIYFLTQFLSVSGYIKWIIIVVVSGTAYEYLKSKNNIFQVFDYYIRPIGDLFPPCVIERILLRQQEMIIEDSPCRLYLPECSNNTPLAKEEECLNARNYNSDFKLSYATLFAHCVAYMLILILKDSSGIWFLYQTFSGRKQRVPVKKSTPEEDESVAFERDLAKAEFQKSQRSGRRLSPVAQVLPPSFMLLAAGAMVKGETPTIPKVRRCRRTNIALERGLLERRVAAEGLWLRVLPGECLGLLGSDISNKSRILETLGGRLRLVQGDVVGVECHLKRSRSKFTNNLGYCSEKGGLMPDLTGRQHLELYCSLRGVNSHAFIENWNPILDLNCVLDRPAEVLCRGHNRLLAVTLAIVGMPSAVLLDRAANSMDPRSRRKLASAFSVLTNSNRAIVLTSNWWPEVKTLCHRIAFVERGRLMYIGSLLFLRDRLRSGFNVKFETNESPEVPEALQAAMAEKGMFGRACSLRRVDRHMIIFEIKNPNLDWDILVQRLELVKGKIPGVIYWTLADLCAVDVLKRFVRNKS